MGKANMFLPFAFLLSATSAYNLTCHCLNGLACHTNGFCPNGCEIGWYGPGCQVGNVALGKLALQSTNYYENGVRSAHYAVDGKMPSGDSTSTCAHTIPVSDAAFPSNAKKGSAWWVVTLNTTHLHVITNVTLVNRRGSTGERLTNFVILYSNDTEGYPDPSNSTWRKCATENGTVGDKQTYYCDCAAIAKRVAIYLTASKTVNSDAILTLCEVLIYGYEYFDCPDGYSGPGCLLRSCDNCGSIGGNCTLGSCRFDVCPNQSFLPPDCWITADNPSELEISSKAACRSVAFTAVLPDTQPNIVASSLQLQVIKSADQQVAENVTLSLLGTNPVYYNFTNAAADTSYNVSAKLVYCVNGSNCFSSTGRNVLTVLTGKTKYLFSQNASCVAVIVRSTTEECEPLSAIEITCKSEVSGVIVSSSSLLVCGLESDRKYNCSVTAIVNANTIERHSAYIVTEVRKKDNYLLTGSIGGSTAIIIIVLAVSVVVCYRRKRNAGSNVSSVKLETKASDAALASALDVTTLPSVHKDNPYDNDNPYESLRKDEQSQTTGDYASL